MTQNHFDGPIGFVGLGRMGQPMAKNLAKKGFSLSVFDVNQAQMQVFTEFNQCRQASSAHDAAQGVKAAITVLPGPADVEQVVLAPDGMLAAMEPGSILMDLSTILPDTTDKLAAACREKGVRFVDSPIGRLAHHADAGESMYMVGAAAEDFDAVKPVLEAMGTTIIHCGGPGAGIRTKLVNNFLAISSCWMNAEAMALAKAFDLDLEMLLSVFEGTTAMNNQFKVNYAAKVFKDDIAPGFQINLAHKDLGLVLDSAQQLKVQMPLAAAAREALNGARAAGWGINDFSALADYACELAGVEKARVE